MFLPYKDLPSKPKSIAESVYQVAATWLAFGLNPEKAIFYRQSDIPEVFELAWILACHTPKGDLNRAHSYKDAVQKNVEKGVDPDHGINMGLFNYPVLMAADILLFDSNFVPVGKDQRQHVEIARSMAQRINIQYKKEILVEPQEVINDQVALIQGLDGRKMSKSYGNIIAAFESSKRLKKLVNKITTDSTPPGEPKDPANSLVFDIYRSFATPEQIEALSNRYLEGISWGEAKAELYEVLEALLESPRERYFDLMANTDYIDECLARGASKARSIARETLDRIRKNIIGL